MELSILMFSLRASRGHPEPSAKSGLPLPGFVACNSRTPWSLVHDPDPTYSAEYVSNLETVPCLGGSLTS
jgi:hypothetical protein